MKLLRRFAEYGFAVVCGALLTGCLLGGRQAEEPSFSDGSLQSGTNDAMQFVTNVLRFRVGDQVAIMFSGPLEPIQPHEERIKEDGTITLPLVGSVTAAGKSPGELQKEIHDLYVPKYYVPGRLTVTVRSQELVFYVGGEVKNEGPKMYVGETTVTKAIQAAGGFSEYANKKKVKLTRAGAKKPITVNCIDAQKDSSKDPQVFPGDKIDVPRRLL
jgi:polysaccharide biosynthesis/export protein VpsN